MSSLSTLPKGDSAWLLRKSIQRIMQQVSVLETNIGSSTTGNSANTQVIFNDAGTLRGDAGLTYNKATDTLSTGSATISGDLTVKTNVLKVDSTNNRVGINTASPTDTLHVYGTGNVLIEGTAGIYAKTITKVGAKSWQAGYRSGTLQYEIQEDGVERLVIANGGNLGLGVTPSAWGSNFKAIESAGASSFAIAGANINGISILSNAFGDNSNWNYKTTGAAARYAINQAQHQWYTAPVWNPATNPTGVITFTQAMTLDASGRLGIGVTTMTEALTVKTANLSTYINLQTSADSGVYLGNNGGALVLSTGSTERARIDASGNLLVGTTTNTDAFRTNIQFSGTSVNGLIVKNLASTGGPILFQLNDSAQTLNTATVSAEYVDSTTQRWRLYKNGGLANYQANNVNLSDVRTKTDIKPLGSYWNKIKSLELVTFKYKDQTHSDDNIGLIAQQVESVAPELVDADGFGNTPEDGVPLKTIYTTDLYHAAIKALQEAMARIEVLESKLA